MRAHRSCRNRRRGCAGGAEGCRGWWEELRRGTFDTNRTGQIRGNNGCPNTMIHRTLASYFQSSFLSPSLNCSLLRFFFSCYACRFLFLFLEMIPVLVLPAMAPNRWIVDIAIDGHCGHFLKYYKQVPFRLTVDMRVRHHTSLGVPSTDRVKAPERVSAL